MNRAATSGFTPLLLATQEGYRAAVSVLIGAGADIDTVTDEHCCEPETSHTTCCALLSSTISPGRNAVIRPYQ